MTRLEAAVNELRSNPYQWEAFLVEGHCAVLAPPGSGKTKLLTTRMANDLLRPPAHPRGAACITLTHAAAGELARRVSALGIPARSSLFIGTVHSFALSRILLPYAEPVGRPEIALASVADSAQQEQAYVEAVGYVYPPEEDTRYIKSTFFRARRMDPTPEELDHLGPRLHDLIRRYEANLRAENLIDFDDIVDMSVQLVEQHPFVRRALRARYPRFYVDEYQDLPPRLDRLVRALCIDSPEGSSLFAVGDPDQAIYGWQGARPRLLRELADLPSVTAVGLTTNYRCGTNIIATSRKVIPGETDGVIPGGEVAAEHLPDGFSDQLRRATEIILAAQTSGTPLHEIGLLCPQNWQCAQAAAALRNRGIPVLVRESHYRSTPGTMLIEALAEWSTAERGKSGWRLGQLLQRWKGVFGFSDHSQRVELVRLLLGSRDADAPGADFVDGLMDVGMGHALAARRRGEEAQEIQKMRKALREGELADLTVSELAERARPQGRVEIMTTSSAKGLEFDVVILTLLEEGLLPFFTADKDPEVLAEERRKFYVSLTRARHELHLLFSGWFSWEKGSITNRGPSRFLREIGLIQ